MLFPFVLFAQDASPSFEVVSIRTATSDGNRRAVRNSVSPGRLDLVNVSLDDVLIRAYSVTRSQIVAPTWVFTDRFDIAATFPPDASLEQVSQMLQRMLRERFHMALGTETRQQDGYALVVGKNGPKLKRAVVESRTRPSGAETARTEPEKKGAMTTGPGGSSHLEARDVTLDQFAGSISKLLGKPVVNQTEIEGTYDFGLDVAAEETRPEDKAPRSQGPDAGTNRDASPASIFTSVSEYGLRLEPRKVSLPYGIVETADRVPTEN